MVFELYVFMRSQLSEVVVEGVEEMSGWGGGQVNARLFEIVFADGGEGLG